MHDFRSLCEEVYEHSFDEDRRRYHRFRYSTHDGSAVADCIGSNLRCAHDWGWCEGILDDPSAGRLHSPEDVCDRLLTLADKHNSSSARFTGMEPIMRDDHLVDVAQLLDQQGISVRIDTNGMLLDYPYLQQLQQACDLRVRLSFKGYTPSSFAQLARVHQSWFSHQIRAFLSCQKANIDSDYVLAGIYTEQDRDKLIEWLPADTSSITVEKLRVCPATREKLDKAGFDLSHVLG